MPVLNVIDRLVLPVRAKARAQFTSAASRLAAMSARYRAMELAYRGAAIAANSSIMTMHMVISTNVKARLERVSIGAQAIMIDPGAHRLTGTRT